MQVAEGSQSMLAMISSPPCVAGDAIIVEAAAYSELTTAVSAGEEISIVVSGSSGTPYGSGSHGRSAVVAYVPVSESQGHGGVAVQVTSCGAGSETISAARGTVTGPGLAAFPHVPLTRTPAVLRSSVSGTSTLDVGSRVPVPFWSAERITVIDEPRPDCASSSSLGKVCRNGKVYVAKGEWMTDEITVKPILQEIFSNAVYSHFGCHAQQLAVCQELPWIMRSNCWIKHKSDTGVCSWERVDPRPQWCTVATICHFVCDCNEEGFHYDATECSPKVPVGPHLLTLWIDGFTPFNLELLAQLQGEGLADGVVSNREALVVTVHLSDGDYTLPVQGIGNILAVAHLVDDRDCLGNSGNNVGYTVVPDADTGTPVWAKAIKIDPGYAFCEGWSSAVDGLSSIAKRTVFMGSQRSTQFWALPTSVRQEFLSTIGSIVASGDAELRGLFDRPGLEELFPDQDAIEAPLAFFKERRDQLKITYQEYLLPLNCTEDLRLMLERKYIQDVRMRDPVNTWEYFPVEQQFVNLKLLLGSRYHPDDSRSGIAVHPRQLMESSSASREEAIVNWFEAIHRDKISIEMKNVFAQCTGTTCRVNIIGGAGTGKTTFCQSVVNCWARGALFSEFHLVFWIPLRSFVTARYPNGDYYSVVDIVIRECLGTQPYPRLRACVAEMLTADLKVLWVLDGYDEIVGRVPDHLTDAFESLMRFPNRILTGRPSAMCDCDDKHLECDAEVEIVGFSDDNIRDFVRRFVGRTAPISVTQDDLRQQSAKLESLLRRPQVVWELAHIPVNLILLCHVLVEQVRGSAEQVRGDTDSSSRRSLYGLYVSVERLLWRRYCVRTVKDTDVSRLRDDQIAELISVHDSVLCDVAFAAMKEGVVVISGEIIARMLRGSDLSVQDVLQTGFLVQSMGQGAQYQYYFLHLTLQEYFAAKRASTLLHHLCDMSDAVGARADLDWLRNHRDDPQLEVLWWFVSGKLAQMSSTEGKSIPLDSSLWARRSSCAICRVEFGLVTRRRHHCRNCGHSVCEQHSKIRLTASSGGTWHRVCDVCVPSSVALRTLVSWWFDSTTTGLVRTLSVAQVKLWLQLAEQAISFGPFNRDFHNLIGVLSTIVRGDVRAVLQGSKRIEDVKWFATLKYCPKVTKSLLYDWDEFNVALGRNIIARGLVKLPLVLADVAQDSPTVLGFIERVWRMPVQALAAKDRVVILEAIAAMGAPPKFDWITIEAVFSNLEVVQDAAAVVIECSQRLFENPVFVSACEKSFISSQSLLQLLYMRRHLFPWVIPRSGAEIIKGRHLCTFSIRDSDMPHDPLAAGLAVSHDDATVAVSDGNNHVVTLFSLGTNRRVTTIGGKGSGRGQLWGPRKLVFSADGILVAEWHNKRVQELTLAGEHVRFIGADVFTGKVHGVTANQDVIVASQPGCEQQIMVFSYRTGDFVKGFGLTGVKCQQLACCYAVQLTHDGRHVVVADWGNSKISIFRLAGQYVKCFLDEAALHLRKATDMCLSDEGEIVVANCESHRISPIFCGRELYGETVWIPGDIDGQFQDPTALTASHGKLYVVNSKCDRLQVFQ